MQLHQHTLSTTPSDKHISIEQSWENRVLCSCVVYPMAEPFLEYQLSLFEEYFAEVMDQLGPDASMKKFRQRLEISLQEYNTKLSVFADKVKQDIKFELRGYIQVCIDGEYLNTLLGPTGLIIIRKNAIAYTVVNDIAKTTKISNFSDVIEGELKHDDRVVITGMTRDIYLDQDDIQIILDDTPPGEFLDVLQNILAKRMDATEIPFLTSYIVDDYVPGFASKVGIKALQSKKIFNNLGVHILQYRQYVIIACSIALLTFFGRWMISGFIGQKSPTFVNGSGTSLTVSVKDIQKDISVFDNLPIESDDKIKKYEEIQQKILILDQQKTQQADVQALKKILEQKYFKGFNTTLFTSLEGLGENIYEFTSQEKDILGTIKQFFWKNGLFVSGEKGVLLNAINQSVRGTLVGAPIGKQLGICTANFQKNGFFCQDSMYQLFSINRQGFTQLGTLAGAFPVGINDMSTFRSSNLYLLVQDKQLNEKGVSLLKYQLQQGKTDMFQAPLEYITASDAYISSGTDTIAKTGTNIYTGNAGFLYNSLAVDSTFLTWNAKKAGVQQFRRPGKDVSLSTRDIPMAGGNAITKELTATTRVLTTAESKYVYLFDEATQSFVIYRSNPLKNNDSQTTSYKLQYFFSFKFSLGNLQIKNVYIQDGEKSILYLLTDNGIISVKLHEYISQYDTPKQ